MSKTITVRVPDIGDFSEVPVIEILVSAGDQIVPEQSLITLESDANAAAWPIPNVLGVRPRDSGAPPAH